MTQISDILYEGNPWWRGKFVLNYKERDIYTEVAKFLSSKQILAFTGLRRTGKTTLMLKIIDDFIKNGFNPQNIIFFSFEEYPDIEIRDVITEYERLFSRSIDSDKYILVLDEIQKLSGWDEKLKWVYDVYSKNLKIPISGSESLFIRKKSKESLAGRIFEFKVELLSFSEFVSFSGLKAEPLGIYERELSRELTDFIRTQGFPELVGITDQAFIKKYISEGIVDKILYKDIPKVFDVRDTGALDSILKILMNEPGQVIEHAKLAAELGISRLSASKYLKYLEQSFLVRKLYNYSRNIRKSERSLKKYYPSIISTDLAFKEEDLYRSKVFEWIIVNQLGAGFFWRDPYKHEVDIVFEDGPVPIEIKYGKIELKGLVAFMEKFGVKRGYIAALQRESTEKIKDKTIFIIPAFKLLLDKKLQPDIHIK